MTENPLALALASGSHVVLERQAAYVALRVSDGALTRHTVAVLSNDEARRIGHWLVTEPAPPQQSSGGPNVQR